MQPTLSFINTVVDTVVWEQEEMEATMVVMKKQEPLHLKEEALALVGHIDGHKGARTEDGVLEEMSTFKQDSADFSRDKNPLRRDPDEDRKCWQCGRFGHVARNCGQPEIISSHRLLLN